MRIFSDYGRSDIVFQFTERIFENKVNKFIEFAPRFLAKFFKRKDKISGVYFSYTWGFKTKEPPIYYTRGLYPPRKKITLHSIINFVVGDMNLTYTQRRKFIKDLHDNKYDEILSDFEKRYYIREIVITFLYT